MVRHPRLSSLVLPAAVLLVAAGLRFAGLDWDAGGFVHPDERRILAVVQSLQWPSPWDWAQVLGPRSPLNPRFFAYGSFPIYLLRLLGGLVGTGLSQLYLPARALSACFDLLTVAAVYAIGRELGGRRAGLLASAFLACSVLSIQLAHYLTVESLLTLLTVLAVWCLMRVARSGSLWATLLAGAFTGLALATKTSALPLLCAGWAAWALWALGGASVPRLGRGIAGLALVSGAAALSFFLAEPYSVFDWFRFAVALVQEGGMARGAVDLPYTRQFIGTLPYLYSLRELVVWSMGVPLGALSLAGLGWLTWQALRSDGFSRLRAKATPSRGRWQAAKAATTKDAALRSDGLSRLRAKATPSRGRWQAAKAATTKDAALRSDGFSRSPATARPGSAQERAAKVATTKAQRREYLVILAWLWPYLLIVGSFHAKFSRYLAPLVPWLCLAAALLVWRAWDLAQGRRRARRLVAGLAGGVLAATFLYALAFTGMYLRPHPWLRASEWINANVPAGSAIAAEEWDDQLPNARYSSTADPFTHVWLDLYAPDTDAKLEGLAESLSGVDYVVLASQRLYGTIGRLPERYPLTAAYYRLLLSGQLGFRLVHVEASYPQLGPLAIVDEPLAGTVLPRPDLPRPAPIVLEAGRADESYSVYDHPRVMIFRKEEALSADELEARIRAAAARP